jgi:hypothetical protein
LALFRSNSVVEDVIGDLIIGKHCCGIEIDIVGQKKRRLGWRGDVFGIMAAAVRALAVV